MSIFYDSKKRKVRPWIMVAFISIPILLVLAMYHGSKNRVQEYQQEQQQKEERDIFDRS